MNIQALVTQTLVQIAEGVHAAKKAQPGGKDLHVGLEKYRDVEFDVEIAGGSGVSHRIKFVLPISLSEE